MLGLRKPPGDSPLLKEELPNTWTQNVPAQCVQGIAEHLPLISFSLSCLWRQKALQEQGEIRIVQLGFDLDAQGIMFTEDYRTRVSVTVCGSWGPGQGVQED